MVVLDLAMIVLRAKNSDKNETKNTREVKDKLVTR